jgi:hypothetical protein
MEVKGYRNAAHLSQKTPPDWEAGGVESSNKEFTEVER